MTIWFQAAWEFCVDKGGVSALTLKRRLNLGSYETVWTILHRYRSAMMLSGVDKLSGTVEVDETFLGGVRSGVRGRGALGKVLVIIAVERHDPKGFGRTRMRVIPDAKAETIKQFLLDNRGLLFYRLMNLAVIAPPLHYDDIVKNPKFQAHTTNATVH